MINLLPPETKQGYTYARRNVILRRWVLICVVALAGLVGVSTYSVAGIQQATADYNKRIDSSTAALKAADYTGTQAKVQDISNSFKLVVKVLDKEVLFSQVLKQIAATIPAKSKLTGLTISQVQGGIDISAVASDYNTGTQLQVNLADPANKLFSKADIVSITCDDKATTTPGYPCKVTVRALFAQKNPFLLTSNGVTKP